MLKTSIGSKVVMAVTGLLLFGFVVGHMLGNLQIFLGPGPLNSYAEKLHDLGGLLWVARIGLLILLVAHVATAFNLSKQNREARPVRYQYDATVRATYASRTMLMTGMIVLFFLLYHLAHFTLQMTGLPDQKFVEDLGDGHTRSHVYNMVVAGFSIWYVVALYVVAQLLLGLHLSHGVSSLLQTLGLNCKKCEKFTGWVGPVAGLIIVAGNVSIPLAVFAGFIKAVGS